MEKKVLSEFGKILMEEVRDIAISEFKDIINDDYVSEESKFIQFLVKKDKLTNEDLQMIVTEMIDRTIFKFLFLFQMNEEYRIMRTTKNGDLNLSEISDGLSGEIFGDDGWIRKYSEYEQIDDWME